MNLRLYHYRDNSVSAFNEALKDYLESNGRRVPPCVLSNEPQELGRGEHGKPYFANPELKDVYFSRSDTNGYVVVCFSGSEIGVDCENTEARPGMESRYARIAARVFTDDERSYLTEGESGAVERFFEIWTAKEAFMKYTGKGFSEGFNSFSVFRLSGVHIDTGRLDGAPHVIYSVCFRKGSF